MTPRYFSQVRLRDVQLDRISLAFGKSEPTGAHVQDSDEAQDALQPLASARINELLPIVRAFSSTSSQPLLSCSRIRQLLVQSRLTRPEELEAARDEDYAEQSKHESDVEWLLVSKATVHTYGLILRMLLDQLLPLSDEIWYWEEVLGSYRYSSLYAIQTSPLRLWALYQQNRPRMSQLSSSPGQVANSTWQGVAQPWLQFYAIVRDSIRERSLASAQGKILSPVSFCRREAAKKLGKLRKMRTMISTGLGILVDEGLAFSMDEDEAKNDVALSHNVQWKTTVSKSVSLMDSVLCEVLDLGRSVDELEERVFTNVQSDAELSNTSKTPHAFETASISARRLLDLLEHIVPAQDQATRDMTQEYGRPSVWVRYWLPAVAAALSSTTILRILVHRRAELATWARDVGVTVRDFWANWVIAPIGKVVRTIRHDETSEIAIMSRDSLKADRESLERMVVDFARDKPHFTGVESSLTEADISAIRTKVGEGDVTPVLRAYEQDLKSPFKGAVRGDLVRSLLIQVQKTKVDLEVAISGIDALLRSQELVFGFVGLTPGILVSIGVFQYLRGALSGRRGVKNSRQAGQSVRVLRNIDRIFSDATPTEDNVLSYKDHGLLVCEIHVLRNLMHKILPRDVEKEFLEDLDDLVKPKGFQTQMRALDRIKWAYAKWLK